MATYGTHTCHSTAESIPGEGPIWNSIAKPWKLKAVEKFWKLRTGCSNIYVASKEGVTSLCTIEWQLYPIPRVLPMLHPSTCVTGLKISLPNNGKAHVAFRERLGSDTCQDLCRSLCVDCFLWVLPRQWSISQRSVWAKKNTWKSWKRRHEQSYYCLDAEKVNNSWPVSSWKIQASSTLIKEAYFAAAFTAQCNQSTSILTCCYIATCQKSFDNIHSTDSGATVLAAANAS